MQIDTLKSKHTIVYILSFFSIPVKFSPENKDFDHRLKRSESGMSSYQGYNKTKIRTRVSREERKTNENKEQHCERQLRNIRKEKKIEKMFSE
jgi:hypothetical protein